MQNGDGVEMNVMYAADDNYAEIMGVSIQSLLEANKTATDIRFFIIEDNISTGNISKLRRMIEGFNRSVEFIQKPNIRKLLGVDLKTLRWSDSAYSRIFLQELFKSFPEVHKVLYVDCDTLIVDNLQSLWDVDVSSDLGAACLECMSNMHKKIIGRKKTDNYINTGMLLLNVDRWIEDDIQTVCAAFIKEHKGKTEYVDQGVINGTISNRFTIVSPRYNLTSLAYDFTYQEMLIYRKPQFGYSEEEWQEAIRNPAIIHFTTSFLSVRPWFESSKHPYAALWGEIRDRSPWQGWPLRTMKDKTKRDRKEALYRELPKELSVHIAGFLHSYVKPVLYVIKG